MGKLNTDANLPIIESNYHCNIQYQREGVIKSAGQLYLILHLHQQYPFTLCNMAHYTSLNPKVFFLKHVSPTPINIAHSTHIDENAYKFHCYDTLWIHHPSFQQPSTNNIPSKIIRGLVFLLLTVLVDTGCAISILQLNMPGQKTLKSNLALLTLNLQKNTQ